MKPIDFPGASHITFTDGIPVNVTHGMVLSRWGMTWRERLSILIYGTVWLAVKGSSMPPILLSGDQTFEIVEQ